MTGGGGARGLVRKEGTQSGMSDLMEECWVAESSLGQGSGWVWVSWAAALGCGWWFGSGERWLRFPWFLVEGGGKRKN